MTIRTATPEDLEAIYSIERICFPANEAASLTSLAKRLAVFPDHFWLVEKEGQLIGYINGMVSDHDTIQDEMFEHAELHNEQGRWQSIFGLAISPDYRKQGYASTLVNHLIDTARQQNRKGITLTCKKVLISYHEKLGFYNAGLSKSVHGGEVWFDLKINL